MKQVSTVKRSVRKQAKARANSSTHGEARVWHEVTKGNTVTKVTGSSNKHTRRGN